MFFPTKSFQLSLANRIEHSESGIRDGDGFGDIEHLTGFQMAQF